jgi:hypothetical protein
LSSNHLAAIITMRGQNTEAANGVGRAANRAVFCFAT